MRVSGRHAPVPQAQALHRQIVVRRWWRVKNGRRVRACPRPLNQHRSARSSAVRSLVRVEELAARGDGQAMLLPHERISDGRISDFVFQILDSKVDEPQGLPAASGADTKSRRAAEAATVLGVWVAVLRWCGRSRIVARHGRERECPARKTHSWNRLDGTRAGLIARAPSPADSPAA